MKKTVKKDEAVVHSNHEPKKPEKLRLEAYFTVRRHSRVLYIPLEPTAVRLHDIQKGDIIRALLIDLRKAPRPDEPIREPKSKWEEEE